jgi:CHAT domain-containing protein/Tfp pilus assembly protein PilF
MKGLGFLIEGNIYSTQEGITNTERLEYEKKALDAYSTSQKIFKNEYDYISLAKVENALGLLYERQGLLQESLAAHKKALTLRTSPDFTDYRGQATSWNNICKVYVALVEIDNALEACDQSQKLARKYKFETIEAESLGNLALIYHYKNHSTKALEYLKNSLKIYENRGALEKYRSSALYNNISVVNMALGNFDEAFQYGEKALETLPSCFMDKRVGMLNTFGVALQKLGKYEKALKQYNQALTNQDILDVRRQAEILTNIGTVFLKMATSPLEEDNKRVKLQKAKENYQKALKIDRTTNNARGIALNISNLGLVEMVSGNFTQALAYYAEAFEIDQAIDNVLGQAYDLGNIGYIYYQLGDFQNALIYYEKQLNIPYIRDFKPVMITALYGKGKVFKAQGKLSKALELYQQSITIIEQIRGNIKDQFSKMSFLEDKLKVYKEIVLLLLEMGDSERALYYAEKAKSRTFLELLKQTDIELKEGANKNEIEQHRKLKLQLRTLTDQLNNKQFETPSENRDRSLLRIKDQIATLEPQLKNLEEQIVNSDYNSLVQAEPLPLKKLQKMLSQDIAILEYFMTDNFIIVWVITKDEVHVKQIPRQQTQRRYSDLKIFIAADKLSGDKRTDFITYTDDTQQELYDLLIQPIKEYIQGRKKLVIIPHSFLHYLPFHAFQHNGIHFIEEFEILYAPSYSVLGSMIGHSIPFTGDALIVGNPDGSLPSSEIEAEKIGEMLPLQSIVLTRKKATENRVRKLATQKNILHFATHSLFNRFNPLSSYILLTEPDKQEEADGLLEAWEIFGMELNGYLATLSACKTKGNINNGDEIVGLARAFFYAGIPSLLVSLWDVDDAYTTFLMTEFYKNLTQKNMDKSQALQQAQIELLKSENKVSVMYWAPFVLIGNYQ